VQRHDWSSAIESVGIDERWGWVVVECAAWVGGVVVGLRGADVFWRWRAGDR